MTESETQGNVVITTDNPEADKWRSEYSALMGLHNKLQEKLVGHYHAFRAYERGIRNLHRKKNSALKREDTTRRYHDELYVALTQIAELSSECNHPNENYRRGYANAIATAKELAQAAINKRNSYDKREQPKE